MGVVVEGREACVAPSAMTPPRLAWWPAQSLPGPTQCLAPRTCVLPLVGEGAYCGGRKEGLEMKGGVQVGGGGAASVWADWAARPDAQRDLSEVTSEVPLWTWASPTVP